MFKRIFLGALVIVFGVAMVGMVSAEVMDMDESECNDQNNYWYEDTCYTTENEKLNAQITSLNKRIDELLGMLEDQESEEEKKEQQQDSSSCEGISFDRSLKVGMEGEDVKCLQVMLNRELEEPLAESGPGSPGNETSYFGSITKRGVKRFQERYQQDVLAPHGLQQGTGYVGRTTRQKLNERLKKREGKREGENGDQEQTQESEKLISCETDEDCILVNENCCGCENGGGKKCINKEFTQSWKSELNCKEKESIACPTVYLCNDLPSGCKCVNNTCQTTE